MGGENVHLGNYHLINLFLIHFIFGTFFFLKKTITNFHFPQPFPRISALSPGIQQTDGISHPHPHPHFIFWGDGGQKEKNVGPGKMQATSQAKFFRVFPASGKNVLGRAIQHKVFLSHSLPRTSLVPTSLSRSSFQSIHKTDLFPQRFSFNLNFQSRCSYFQEFIS